eukprot:2700046-Pleurochrysis_carterae.AAC.7
MLNAPANTRYVVQTFYVSTCKQASAWPRAEVLSSHALSKLVDDADFSYKTCFTLLFRMCNQSRLVSAALLNAIQLAGTCV